MNTDELKILIREAVREELIGHQHPVDIRVLRIHDVAKKTGLAKATIYEKERKGEFPARFKVGGKKSSGWLMSDVDTWILKQAQHRSTSG